MTEGPGRDTASLSASVSVVVPAHRADEGLRACLASIAAFSPPPGEVIVVVDGEAPACAALAAGIGARTIATAGGAGPAVARNLGAREATGAVVFFLDADVVVPRDLVGRVAAILSEDPGLDGVFGSYDEAPAAPDVVSVFRNLLHHHVHQTGAAKAFSFWSGCGALRRSAFLESGGFDESYRRPSVEDIELGSRLVRAGGRIRLDRSLQVKHLKRWSLAGMVVTDVRDRALPWTELILRERRLPSDLNLGHGQRLAAAAAIGLVAALGALPAYPGPAAAVAAGCLLAYLVPNLPFYRLLATLRGPGFLAAALPLHLLHYLCGAAGFGAGLARRALGSVGAPRSGRADGDADGERPGPVPARADSPELAAARAVDER